MRRRTTAAVVSLILGLGVLAGSPALADEAAQPEPEQTAPAPPSPDQAADALETADRVLEGKADVNDPSATLALRDLRVALPRLAKEDRAYAKSILARPSDGAADIYGNGYSRDSSRQCSALTCVHWIPRSADYVDRDEVRSDAYLTTVQDTVEANLTRMVDQMGYRRPVGDGTLGGNAKFDVYLADLDSGLFGYCAPEQYSDTSYAFCVLDNDYAEPEFAGNTPVDNMRVTAAHELFHAVQFAYDSWEDYWLMEATATWMEERLADDVNDNRNFLPYGQLGAPQKPLDVFEQAGSAQYGNWSFFEFISHKHGNNSVRAIWTKAGSYPGAGRMHSARAVSSYLSSGGRGGFRDQYSRYVAQNSWPELNYPEGAAYRVQPLTLKRTLKPSRVNLPSTSFTVRHLSSRTVRMQPHVSMSGPWRLRINVNLTAPNTGAKATVLLRRKDGSSFTRQIDLKANGNGKTTVEMDDRSVAWVNVSLVNASVRYDCWRATYFSCQGKSRDDNRTYTVRAKAYRTD